MKLLTGKDDINFWLEALVSRRTAGLDTARASAARTIAEVRAEGDSAVARALQQFDGVTLDPSEILTTVEPDDARLSRALELAIDRVRAFHAPQAQSGYDFADSTINVQHRVRPLRRVGIYVPGGKAVYLSTLIMCAVPAKLAGVEEIVISTTPAAAAHPDLIALCQRLGIREIYRCGGAAGIAALALGTQTLRRVDKIVGPGNGWVTAAKQMLYGDVAIDMTAGPTEVVVIADETADARVVAADLLAQAEHGPDSSPILITDSVTLAREVIAEVSRGLAELPSKSAEASTSGNGGVLVIDRLDDAVAITNSLAPEHVLIMGERAETLADRITDSGAVFVGARSAVALGDYILGPNHVLPTAGAARFFSVLGVYDFYKRSNVVRQGATLSQEIIAAASELARVEGLPLHAASIDVRASLVLRQSETFEEVLR